MKHIDRNNIPAELYSMPAVIYGGGYTGRLIIELLTQNGVQIKCIIDDNERLQKTYIENIEVISFQQFKEYSQKFDQTAVIITTIYGKAVLKKLQSLDGISVYELYDWYMDLSGNKNRVEEYIQDVDKIENMKAQVRLLKGGLADEKSRSTLEGIIHYLDTKDINVLFEVCVEDEQYFIPEIKKAIKNPLHIIDAGAYRGELLQNLENNDIAIEKWYCFEADKENFKYLQEQSKNNKLKDGQQVCINKGLWSKSGQLYFESGKGTASKIVPYETKNVIDVVSIDEYLEGVRCNFIKMDIEGAELPALQGGIELIRKERPILAISIYHSLDDFWQIPEYLMQELDNYRYYIRHHSLIFCETVLYGIPCEL